MSAGGLWPRISLKLSDDLEHDFLELYFLQSVSQMRFALGLGLFLYASFGLLDTIAAPSVRAQLWVIRYAIVCPFFVAMIAFTYTSAFRRASQQWMALAVVLAGFGIVAMTAIATAPANYLYHAGLLLVEMFAFGFARMRFVWASVSSVIVIVTYLATTIVAGVTPTWIILNNAFFLISALILGGFACYSIERYARSNFVQTRQLVRANAELIESRQLVIESSKRAQLIFSALVDALPGTDLENKYRLEEKIGSGSFGTVYRARHLLLDAPVAVKIFRPMSGKNMEKSFERFRLEGISGKKISHPNAVSVLDFGIANSAVAFLVMELLEGRTLADELRACGRIPPKRCAEIAVPVCSVLADAHDAGIIHRDIKPGNIFLHQAHSGEMVKVVDFGIAKLLESSADEDLAQLTATGALIGTPAYMAPERLTQQTYGASSDVYSVGVLLYEMLTGHLPHATGESSYWKTVVANITAPVPHPDVEVEMPPELADVIVQSMARDPDARPSAHDMAHRIAGIYSLPVPRSTLSGEKGERRSDVRVSAEAPTEIL